jgi:hypothetical protein
MLAREVRKRFVFLAPVIAFAVGGLASNPSTAPTATPSTSAPASPVDELSAAKQAIEKAYEAESVYKVDNLVYAAAAGDELDALKMIEPAIVWGTQVLVQLPTKEAAGAQVLILRAPLSTGGSLCLSEVGEVDDAGIYYARAAIGKACPPFKAGMPGWTKDDRDAGWA